jgi:hypothetical protein
MGIGVDTTGSHCRRTAPDVFAAAQAWVELADFVPAFLAGQTGPSTLLSPWHDMRARGLGGRPVSCGEENLLDFQGPPCHTENIFIREFGHALHGALAGLDEQFNTPHVPPEDTRETNVCSIDHHCRDLADSVSRRRR